MKTAKVFMNGQSQAVRLPKECRFDGTEVYVRKIGGIVLLIPKVNPWVNLRDAAESFSDDFFEGGRQQGEHQKREAF